VVMIIDDIEDYFDFGRVQVPYCDVKFVMVIVGKIVWFGREEVQIVIVSIIMKVFFSRKRFCVKVWIGINLSVVMFSRFIWLMIL
ncbi:hypothetical protein, partial [Klebsiella pneumoniae]|uniref:hypothetical protein n=1 Tax=Klebsiella pneumoniae TaxID=573 RepID=UPI00194DAF7A